MMVGDTSACLMGHASTPAKDHAAGPSLPDEGQEGLEEDRVDFAVCLCDRNLEGQT